MGLIPQHLVTGVDVDLRVQPLCQLRGHGDVVVVGVGADHPTDLPAVDGVDDGVGVMGGVHDDHLVIVTDDPDVVVDLPFTAVEGEDAVGDDAVNAQAGL